MEGTGRRQRETERNKGIPRHRGQRYLSGYLLSDLVGNGYVATVVGSDTIYLAGVFNGEIENVTSVRNDTNANVTEAVSKSSHRAAIPGTNGISIKGERLGSALDLANATFYRR